MQQYFFYQNDKAIINSQVELNEEQKFWREHFFRRYALMKWARQQNGREDKWNEHQKMYEAERPPRSLDDWQSTIVPPFTTSVVESALSEMVDQTLRPQVQARSREHVPAATVLNFTKDYTWEVGYGDVELYKSLKQELILGSTIWQEYYWQDKRSVKQIISYNPKTGAEEYRDATIFDFDDVYGETVNLWDVWWDPAARTANTGPYKAQDVVRRYIMHIDNFRNTFKGSKWDKFGVVDKIKPSGDVNYYQYYQPSRGVDSGNYIEVFWYWLRNPDKLVILANDIPFYIGPNPYNHKQLPFAVGYDIMDPWSIYGKGEPGLLESIQDELTTIRRMRLDRQKLDIYKMIFVSNREALNDNDLIPAPMKPVYVEDVNNIKSFEYGDINPSAYREEQLLKEDGRRVTGIDDQAQSVPEKGSTATQAAILKEATLKRLKMKIWLTSRTLLQEQIRLRVPNIMQFYKTPKVEEIMGKNAIDLMLKIRQAEAEGRLIKQGGRFFEQNYRTIVTRNKELVKNPDGTITVNDRRGDNYFTVTPDLLSASMSSFNFKLSAEPTFPLSKPLLQQKVNELFQHPLMVAAFQKGYLSVDKAVDKMLEVNDFDVDDFAANPMDAQTDQLLIDPNQMLQMAEEENQRMLQGEALIGTPFASIEHTQAHLAFMSTPEFKMQVGGDTNILQIFARHVMEEAMAHQVRSVGAEMQNPALTGANNVPQNPNQLPDQGLGIRGREAAGITRGAAKATMPARQMGPEGVPDVTGMMNRVPPAF